MSAPAGRRGEREAEAAAAREGAIVRVFVICNKRGLHARASAKFVQTVEKFDADVRVMRGGETVGGTSIMGLMMLAATPGTSITVEATGNDAAEVMDALADAHRFPLWRGRLKGAQSAWRSGLLRRRCRSSVLSAFIGPAKQPVRLRPFSDRRRIAGRAALHLSSHRMHLHSSDAQQRSDSPGAPCDELPQLDRCRLLEALVVGACHVAASA